MKAINLTVGQTVVFPNIQYRIIEIVKVNKRKNTVEVRIESITHTFNTTFNGDMEITVI